MKVVTHDPAIQRLMAEHRSPLHSTTVETTNGRNLRYLWYYHQTSAMNRFSMRASVDYVVKKVMSIVIAFVSVYRI
jgi:hypothetical protein